MTVVRDMGRRAVVPETTCEASVDVRRVARRANRESLMVIGSIDFGCADITAASDAADYICCLLLGQESSLLVWRGGRAAPIQSAAMTMSSVSGWGEILNFSVCDVIMLHACCVR
mmetsp:Transcript_460/g.907  ORF Transcript_460/g.907 Transcript_460/m.907 type:complete len:115 (-) Transcript_460:32-376(-)